MSFNEIRRTLEQAIEKALDIGNISTIEEVWIAFRETTKKDMVTHLDDSFRSYVLKITEAAEPNLETLESLIALNIECCHRRLSSLQLPSILLLDIFEILTIADYAAMFFYVENVKHVLMLPTFYEPSKNNMLRLCNELLGRLPKHGEFKLRTRIHVFLAEFFPLTERSGTNLHGNYNAENVTDVAPISDDEEHAELYNGLWSLVDFFREPPRCYIEWNDFIALAGYVLNSFDTIKVDPYITRKHDTDVKYVPKYCAQPKFFGFQLHDHGFRRSILLQLLIILQYLETTKFELTEDQTEWITLKREDAFNLLTESQPNGADFVVAIKNMLKSELRWIQWKKDGCKEIAKPTLSNISRAQTEKRTIGEIVKEANDKGLFYMGNSDLTDLWNLEPDNLKACKADNRNFLPTLEEFYFDMMNGNPSLFKEDKIRWMALRLLSRSNPKFFNVRYKMDLNSIFDFALECISQEKSVDEPKEEQDLTEKSEEAEEDYLIDFKIAKITKKQFDRLCLELSEHWESIAVKLGYDEKVIGIVGKLHTKVENSQAIIQSWFEECDESALQNFFEILEDLRLEDVVCFLQSVITQNKFYNLDCTQ